MDEQARAREASLLHSELRPLGERAVVGLLPDEADPTVDGQVGVKMQPGDLLTIVKSKVAVKLIAPADKNYFDVLRGKLKWG